MTQISFKSAGVSAREIDISGPTSIQPLGIPAAVISTTEKGPAFIPYVVPTIQDYKVSFGNASTNKQNGPLAAFEWLKNQQALMQVRVLGVGNGSARVTSGLNKGSVTDAGFLVGDQQPQNNGSLNNNAYAYATSTGPTAFGTLGRTHFLGCFMSQSTNSTLFTDAGLAGSGVPLIRGVLMAASGVLPLLSSSRGVDSSAPTGAGDITTTAAKGFFTGSLIVSNGKQEFVLLLNGHKGTDPLYPNVITASFDPDAANYFGSLMNKDPVLLEKAGYLLYSHWDVYSSLAVPTGSGAIIAASGSGALGISYENISFIVTGSATRNSGSAVVPNYENFADRYRTAGTPWIISQQFGGRPQNLFKVWSLSDGDSANTEAKISIENIAPSNTDTYLYGTFDLLVRDFNDTDGNKIILEQWRGLTLDPESPNFIARVIGDTHLYFNFDTADSNQRLEVENGNFENRSRFIRVELNQDIFDGDMPEAALPVGFRGPQHLVTSGSSPMLNFTDSLYFNSSNHVFKSTVQLPVPYRKNINKGTGSVAVPDRNFYWGVQFEKLINASEPNAGKSNSQNIQSFAKYYPNFQTEWMDFAVSNNEGTSDSAENGVIDADRFNYNKFSLENIRVIINTSTLLPDTNSLRDWVYIRNGNISTTASSRALTVSDLLDPSTRTVSKFTVHFEGGFNGTRIFDRDASNLTNKAIVEELNFSNRGLTSGPTVKAYQKAINLLSDMSETDYQIITIPGIRSSYITDLVVNLVESERTDAFFIMDIEERDTNNLVVSSSVQQVSVKNTASAFRTRGLNSSYSAAYFPDQILFDTANQTETRVPPSVVALGVYGKNDAVGYPWFAPAGLNRGVIDAVQQTALTLNRNNMDELYSININPIVVFGGKAPSVWGQKTLLARQSAFERVNVRRLLLTLRREIKSVGLKYLFEPATVDTISAFNKAVQPILKRVQDQAGLESFVVKIDTSTTTQADLDNKIMKGKIFLVPTKTLEFFQIDFVITNRANF